MSDWLVYYLVGCALVVFLSLFGFVLFTALDWIFKGRVLRKNLKKLDPPDEETLCSKALAILMMILLEVALSWIGVALQLWNIATRLLAMVREVFSSTPEELKVLRYPLHNNPQMSREAVWAYLRAIETKFSGTQLTEGALCSSLAAVVEYYPYFDRIAALNQLKHLDPVNADVIAAALNRFCPPQSEGGRG